MSEATFLTDEEIVKLTVYTRKAEQCRELERMGIPFKRNRLGEPIVARAAAVRVIGGGTASNERYVGPNLEALKAVS